MTSENLTNQFLQFLNDLRLPDWFFLDLLKEDDWSFIIKLHVLLEVATTDLITHALGQDFQRRLKAHHPTIGNFLRI